MRLRLLCSIILSAAAALSTTPAFASSSASASVSILSVQLFDLDAGDGIAPGITWNAGSIAQSFGQVAVSHQAAPGLDQYGQGLGSGPFGTLNVGVASGFGQAQVSVTGGNGFNPLGGTVLAASGSTTGSSEPGGGAYTTFSALALAPDDFYVGGTQFTLTANTIAVFRATASVSATALSGTGGDAYAEASASLSVLGTGPTDTGSVINPCACGSGVQSVVDVLAVTAAVGQTFANNGTLLVSFTNATGIDKTGFLGVDAFVNGGSSIAPVPEPGQTALLVAGLAMIGLIVRRRRG